jgi:Tol biopolymer transport system component
MPGRRWAGISDFSWLTDGSGILLAANDKNSAPVQLWIVTYPGGGVRRLTNDLSSYVSASVSVRRPHHRLRAAEPCEQPLGGSVQCAR